jgi:hypothetical protein
VPWQTIGEDLIVEVAIDPTLASDLLEIAMMRPVWILETPQNKTLIDAAWKAAESMNLFEINRCPVVSASAEQEFIDLLPTIHQHYNWSNPRFKGIRVRGVGVTDRIREDLDDCGYRVMEASSDSFTARPHSDPEYNTWDFVGGGIKR